MTFPVPHKNGRKFVTFDETPNELVVYDPEIQKGIEESEYFKQERILLIGADTDVMEGDALVKKPVEFDPVEFKEVTDINAAVDILKKNPYRIHHSKLQTPDSVLKAAESVNVSFPNLIIE